MNNEEVELIILKNAENIMTQKSFANEIGHSVGKVNYVLKKLIEKGLIKAVRFMNSDKKHQYKYLLTDEGIKEKIKITDKFIKRKKLEYDNLKADMKDYTKRYNYIGKLYK